MGKLLVAAVVLLASVAPSAGSQSAKRESAKVMKVIGESLVLAGRTPGKLCFDGVVPGSVVVRSTYEPSQKGTVVYQQGRDYVMDYAHGTIARSPASTMPDFSKNVLYGKKSFDHTKVVGIQNHTFFVWVDYETKNGHPFATRTDQSALLPKTAAKLKAGGPFKIVAYGDSITQGGEASTEALRFPNLYAKSLQTRFPKAQVTLENGATGGDTTMQGMNRLEEKVLSRKPDLVLVSFGMNDHNIAPYGHSVDKFGRNLASIVSTIRDRTGAEIILISTFPPNDEWMISSHSMDKYAQETKRVAAEQKCAYADLYSIWAKMLERKDSPSLLGNNINHPNDFGHWLYLQALEAVGF